LVLSDDKWLTVEEIGLHLSVSKDTIYKWIEQKSMPAHRVGRKWMFQKSEVDKWVKSGRAADAQDAK
jgi:excisionase family DNA binding protein